MFTIMISTIGKTGVTILTLYLKLLRVIKTDIIENFMLLIYVYIG